MSRTLEVAEVAWPPQRQPLVYVCRPTAFVEPRPRQMVDAGYEPRRNKPKSLEATEY
jgi:hypothetical protein